MIAAFQLPPSLSLLLEWLSSRSHLIQLAVALSLLLLLPSIVKVLWKQWRIFKAFQKVPSDPRHQHLILGHTPKFLSDMGEALDWVRQISLENGWKTMKIRIGPGVYFLVGNHPDAAQVMLRSDPKSDQIYDAFVPWLGRGLLIANGQRWARARRLLTPAFHFDILRPYIKVYNDAARVLVNQWRETPEGEAFDVCHSISLFTLDVMLRCSCSFESNCQVSKSHNHYISAVYQLSDLSTTRAMSPLLYYDIIYMMTPSYWKYRKACKIVHKFSMDVIKKRRAILKEKKKQSDGSSQGTKRKYLDFIDILLEARDESNVGLTDLEIRAEVDTFMFEGHDTTSNGLAWTLYNLATHPEHQEKCRQEVDAIFSEKDENDEDVTSDDMKRLVYLKYCIKESLRLFPPVSVVGRVLDQDTNITGHVMPKGTSVTLSIYAIHRHPDFWENPDEFDPLRFTPENSKGRHPHAFIPFSAGPRNCIEKVCSYDASVYGTPRKVDQRNMPGILCRAAVDEKGDIVGYIAIRQFIKDKGKEIQLGLAPLYANNDQIAKALLKVATKAYQENKQTSSSKIDFLYCDGESCGNHASQLMKELEASATLIGPRMYTRGIPPGRQQEKMYSIYLPAFD